MSLALLKNLLFAADRKRKFPSPDLLVLTPAAHTASASRTGPFLFVCFPSPPPLCTSCFGILTHLPTEPNLPPNPPSIQNPSHKDGEISWLSSEPSSGVNTKSNTPPPSKNNDSNDNNDNNSTNDNNDNNSTNEKQVLSNFFSVPESSPFSSDSNDQLPEERNGNVESDQTSDDDLEAQKQKKRRISPRMISDAIIGISDGMTVPFALTAGLAYLGDTKVVVLGGLAELIAGALSMGLGGFIGAKSEAYIFPHPTTPFHNEKEEQKPN